MKKFSFKKTFGDVRSFLSLKFSEWKDESEFRREQNDEIYLVPVHEKTAVNETKTPLRKGSIDGWFFLWALIILCFGAVMNYSASAVYAQYNFGNSFHFLSRYILYAVLAIAVTVPCVIFFRPWHWRVVGTVIFAAALLLLAAVLIVGTTRNGAKRWIEIGPVLIQPSEIAKVGVVMMLALFFSEYQKKIRSRQKFGGGFLFGFIIPMIIIGLPVGLIVLEKHISGIMIVGMIGLVVMLLGGTNWKYIGILVGLMATALVVLIALFPYAQDRLEIWLHIDRVDPLGEAWQTLQGLYAIASGGFFGVGIGGSTQKFGYVPEPQNDFIFTIVCEELGFIGAFAVLFLFFMLVWRGITLGSRCPSVFGKLVTWGLTMKIAVQVMLNIAVVTNSMPNTGISLPFFSSGGTSLMIQIFEIGIILSISRYRLPKKSKTKNPDTPKSDSENTAFLTEGDEE